MATQPPNKWLDDAISVGADEWIPLIFLSDGSPFSQQAAEAFSALLDGACARMVIHAEMADWRTTFAAVASGEFRSQIHPARLWEDQSTWAILVADLDYDGTQELLQSELPSMVANTAVRPLVLPFLKGEFPVAEWPVVLRKGPAWPNPTFLLSDRDAHQRRSDVIARGLAAFVFAGWLTYTKRRDGLLREALGLSGEERWYSLGMAVDEPDWRFHTRTWTDRATQRLAEQWSSVAGSAEKPNVPPALDLTIRLAPSINYSAHGEGSARGPALVFGQKTIHLSFSETPILPEFSSDQGVSDCATRMHRLRKFRDFLWLSERRTAESLVTQKGWRWQRGWRDGLIKALRLPGEPLGLLRWIGTYFEHGRQYLDALAQVEVKPQKGMRSLETNLKRVAKKEAGIPHLGGALLRFALIAVGSAWTVWGTLFWARRIHVWNDPGMRHVFLGSIGVLAGLLLMIFLHYALARLVAWRAEQLTKRDLLDEFMNGVVTSIRKSFLLRVKEADREVEGWLDALAKLNEWAKDPGNGAATSAAAPMGNSNPRFVDSAFSGLLEEHLSGLVRMAHQEVVKTRQDDPRWPSFEIRLWQEDAKAAVKRVVSEIVAKLDYDACVKAANWGDSAKDLLLRDLAADARKPAFNAGSAVQAPVILLGSLDWSSFARGDDIRCTGNRLPYLCAVSAVPLRLVELEGI
jgi:hypothetical protein